MIKYMEGITFVLSIMFLLILSFFRIRNNTFPVIMGDEFGYLSNAALTAGYKWYDIAAMNPYYSYLYSVFLIPIFYFVKSSALIYQCILWFNTFLLLASYLMAYYFFTKYISSERSYVAPLIALVSVATSANLFYSQTALCESFLVALYWILILLFSSLDRKFSFIKVISILICLVVLYCSHQRNLAIFGIMGVFLLGICFFQKDKKIFVFCIISVGIAFFLALSAQKHLVSFQKSLLNNREMNTHNIFDVSSDLATSYISKLISSFRNFVDKMLGLSVSILISTMGLLVFGIIASVRKAVSLIRQKSNKSNEVIYLAIFLMGFALIGLSAVQLINSGSRKDYIVYSRYFDYSVGPMIMLSLYEFGKNKKHRILGMIISVLVFVLAIPSISNFFKISPGGFSVPSSVSFGAFNQIYGTNDTLLYNLTIVFIILLLVIMSLFKMSSNKKMTIMCLMLVVFNIFSFLESSYWMDETKADLDERFSTVEAILDEYSDAEIFLIPDEVVDGHSDKAKILQFRLRDREIQVIHNVSLEEDANKNKYDNIILLSYTNLVNYSQYQIGNTRIYRVYLVNSSIINSVYEEYLENEES